jgi:hypothetical protein
MEIWTRRNGVTNPLALSRGRSHYRARVPDIGLVFCRPDGLYPARPSTPSWTKAGATGFYFPTRTVSKRYFGARPFLMLRFGGSRSVRRMPINAFYRPRRFGHAACKKDLQAARPRASLSPLNIINTLCSLPPSLRFLWRASISFSLRRTGRGDGL